MSILIDDWKKVLFEAWSARFGMAAGLFTFLNALVELGVVLPYLEGYLPPKTFLVLAMLCGVAGFISRFLKQQGFDDAGTEEDQQAA